MSKKIIILGNSGSGKSTIARKLSEEYNLKHLDLDTLAWLKTDPPQRKKIQDSQIEIERFMRDREGWIIEGCYSDLIELIIPESDELIYMDLPIEICIQNAKERPWEPHKYQSKAEQDDNLEMLINWIKDYDKREDEFSKKRHDDIFKRYPKSKRKISTRVD